MWSCTDSTCRIIHSGVDGEDLGDFKLMNSSQRSKTQKKYREIDKHFKKCLIVEQINYYNSNLKVVSSIPYLSIRIY